MTDTYDRDREEKDRELSVRKKEGPPACGACYWCGETVAGNRRFCDKTCADDWRYHEERKQPIRIF